MKKSVSAPSLTSLATQAPAVAPRPINKNNSASCNSLAALAESANIHDYQQILMTRAPVTQVYQCLQSPDLKDSHDIAACVATPHEAVEVEIARFRDAPSPSEYLDRYQIWYKRLRRKQHK